MLFHFLLLNDREELVYAPLVVLTHSESRTLFMSAKISHFLSPRDTYFFLVGKKTKKPLATNSKVGNKPQSDSEFLSFFWACTHNYPPLLKYD